MRTRLALIMLAFFTLALAVSPAARADSFTFATIPASGSISGPAGSTIGWGYTITNNSATNYLETIAVSAAVFVFGTPTVIFDFPIIAPMTTVTVAYVFDPVNPKGLYQLTWDVTAPTGFVNSGMFSLTGDFCTDSLCANPIPNSSMTQNANYSATVTQPIPEPGTLLLLATGLATIVLRRRRS